MSNKGLRKLKKILRDKVISHHIVYAYNGVGNHKQTDIEVPIYYMEHNILTALQRRGSRVSQGLIQALKYFIWETETKGTAVNLTLPTKERTTIEDTKIPIIITGASQDFCDCKHQPGMAIPFVDIDNIRCPICKKKIELNGKGTVGTPIKLERDDASNRDN